jgi:hypothetical protein
VQRVRPVIDALIDKASPLNSGEGFFVACNDFPVYFMSAFWNAKLKMPCFLCICCIHWHLIAVSLDWRWDSPPLPLVLMQSALCSFSVPPAHRNWLIAVLNSFSYLTGMLSVAPTKHIIGSNCAFITFDRPTSVRQHCFQLLVNALVLSTSPSQFFWLMSA